VPVPEYREDFLDRATDEVERMPERAAVVQMLEDYSVMRGQGRVTCHGHPLLRHDRENHS